MNSAMIQEKVNNFIEHSKRLGLKVTPQRIAIYRELAITDKHPSTENIYKKIKDYYPNISLTTVYRTLETFEKLGLVSIVNVLSSAARYDANLETHHHIVCSKCKKVEDVYDESLNKLNISAKTLGDYKVHGYSLILNGTCRTCRDS